MTVKINQPSDYAFAFFAFLTLFALTFMLMGIWADSTIYFKFIAFIMVSGIGMIVAILMKIEDKLDRLSREKIE